MTVFLFPSAWRVGGAQGGCLPWTVGHRVDKWRPEARSAVCRTNIQGKTVIGMGPQSRRGMGPNSGPGTSVLCDLGPATPPLRASVPALEEWNGVPCFLELGGAQGNRAFGGRRCPLLRSLAASCHALPSVSSTPYEEAGHTQSRSLASQASLAGLEVHFVTPHPPCPQAGPWIPHPLARTCFPTFLTLEVAAGCSRETRLLSGQSPAREMQPAAAAEPQ